ncbi:MAG: UvrD-helicase domain-containing protein [Candidatus Latescibacterota bacterium]
MPVRDLDSEQKLAATSDGAEVVVSAGAGSGKTSLLVGRYLYELMTNTVPMHEIAAITFTNKAADQMKARIARRIPELTIRYPEHAGLWTGLVERIHTAPISTIHSFCNSILRAYPLEAGIDPLFQIINETTLAGLKREAWQQFFELRMDEEPDRCGVLLRALGMRGLRQIMMGLIDRRAHVITWLDRHGIPDPESLEESYRRFILGRLGKYRSLLRDFHAVRPGGDAYSLSLNALLYEFDEVRRGFENGVYTGVSFERFRAAVRESGRKGSKKLWETAGATLAEVKSGVKECLDFLEAIESWLRYERGVAAVAASCLLDEFTRFEQFFLDLKKSRSCLDNDDSLIETWRLLRQYPAVCSKVSGSYRHILVDEFQDTDGLQLDILRMITGNSVARLFTVGDPKQSIYRFRGADVTVFNQFTARPGVDYQSLKINYRSSPAIIEFVNHTFGRILGLDDPEFLFEARYAEMKPFRKDRNNSPNVEIAVFEAGDADACRSREGEFIAQRALEMREQGYTFGEMALLLRKGTQARRYEESFLRAGVPFVNLAGGDPFESPEAYDIANLLGWLCEPGDQTLFTAVMLSPFFRVDADFLYTLRKVAGKSGSLPETFLRTGPSAVEWEGNDAERIREALRKLLAARDRRTIRELLGQAFEETGYTLVLLADPIRGEESLAVLDLLLRAADNFENNGGTIREFARLLRSGDLKTNGTPSLETRQDALTIITIHKAKGMEYKIVFLADAGGRPKNESPFWLFHDELGPGFTLQSPSGKTVKTLALSLTMDAEKRKALAESKRLFYVACTRAENHLVISGGRPSKTPDPDFEKDNWMGWIHDALGVSRDDGAGLENLNGLCAWRFFSESECETRINPAGQWKSVLNRAAASAGPSETDVSRLAIPPLHISGKPATLSPTQAEDYLTCPALYFYKWVHHLDLAAAEELSGGMSALYGELAHHALELWDYRTPDRVIRSVDALARGQIPEFDRKKLRECFRRFADSALCRTLAGADELRREERFAFILEDVLVRGKMDLAARTGDHWVIVDYKTSAVRPEETSENAERYRFQIGIYALALYRAEHVVPEKLIVHFLTPGTSCEISCDKEYVEGIGEFLTRIIGSMDAGDFRPSPSESCKRCAHGKLCRNLESSREYKLL